MQSARAPAAQPALVARAGGVDFKYACTLAVPAGAGSRTSGEILVNSQYDFLIRRISWEFGHSPAIPKVRIVWRDNRRSYMDRPAFITAAFGMPGEDFPMVGQIRIERGTTLTFEATNAQDDPCEIDLVVHGLELRPMEG